MKKVTRALSWLLMLCMVLTIPPVMGQTANITYEPGTYEGKAQGNNGKVVVTVTVTADQITDVTVTDHAETPGISDGAMETIPQQIVATQSLGLDAVSGATVTSSAILAAAAQALEQAGADVAALQAMKAEQTAAGETQTLTADVVVVGGGAAGMSATLRLRELGHSVVLLEKASYLGGTVAMSGGNQVVSGSKLQAEAGVTDDTAELMIADFMKNGNNMNVPELLSLYANHVGETTDWLHAYAGISFDMEGGLHKLGEYGKDRELAYLGGGAGFAETMEETVNMSGTTVLKSTRAETLLVTDGQVVGVEAVSATGEKYIIHSKAVLLATGGYGANRDMLSPELANALYYGSTLSTGDGVTMATAAGIDAATRLMEYGKQYPNGVEVSPGRAKSTIAGNIAAWTMGAILVNREGNRVVNEKASNRTILEAEVAQTGSMLYLVMDAATFDVWKTKLAHAGLTEDTINQYLESNGKETPLFTHGDTLEAAAQAAGMEGAALKATVESYNGYVAAGEDKDFQRDAAFMKQPIGDGPYYIIEQRPRFATTMGGLVVNDQLQVMNKADQPIAGLYAAGELVGGVMGDDSPSGANNGWAVTSGKLAAEFLSSGLEQ